MDSTDAADREFFRLPTSIPVQGVGARSDDWEELVFDGRLLNISGSGVLLLTGLGLTSGDSRLPALRSRERAPSPFLSKCSRQRDHPRGGLFHVGAKFIDRSRHEQDRLVRAIDAEQVSLLERGML